MKKCVLMVMLAMLTLPWSAAAQRRDVVDVVYLKNGSVIRGTIVEQVPGESIKIETSEGNLFVYRIDEVSKMTKEGDYVRSLRNYGTTGRSARNYDPGHNGYMGIVETGYGVGVGGQDGGLYNVSVVNGYQVANYFYAGLGVGLNYLFKPGTVFLPVYAYVRTRPMNALVSPVVALGIGYNASLSSGNSGGLYFEPSLGVNFNLGGKNSFNFSIGYSMSKATLTDWTGWSESVTYGAVLFKAGYTF